jgi:hypothetical protein
VKNLKPRSSRPSPEDALAIATQTAPTLPPARLSVDDRATTLNLRVRSTTIEALMAVAHERGLTMKQVVCQALADAGVPVASADLEDRTPRRKEFGRGQIVTT